VKPSGTIVKTALGLGEKMALADLQFACKAGTQAMQIILNYVAAGTAEYGLAIGADTAQSKPGDVLEFTAGAGAAAYVLGSDEKEIIASCLGTLSIATDTPDFWRRPGQSYPEHAGRFSGEPGYFYHVKKAAKMLMEELNLKPEDFAFCVFHTPNAKFPQMVAKQLGFTEDQLSPALVVKEIGNTYAGASLLALAAVLDQAQPSQKILVVSYGSGAGSDAFVFETTKNLTAYQKKQTIRVKDLVKKLSPISYQDYQRSSAGKE
jgi:hydroxymethylglutaryl-CoA synthase